MKRFALVIAGLTLAGSLVACSSDEPNPAVIRKLNPDPKTYVLCWALMDYWSGDWVGDAHCEQVDASTWARYNRYDDYRPGQGSKWEVTE